MPDTADVLCAAGESTAAGVNPFLATSAEIGGTSPRDISVTNATGVGRTRVWALPGEEEEED